MGVRSRRATFERALPGGPRARALYATGWRPPFAPGPTRDELADIIQTALRPSPALAVAG